MGKFFDAQGQVIAKTIDGCACDSNVQDFTPGLVTWKFEEDPIKIEGAIVSTTLFPALNFR